MNKLLILMILVLSACTKNNSNKEAPVQFSAEGVEVLGNGSFGSLDYNQMLIKSISVKNNSEQVKELTPIISGADASHFNLIYANNCQAVEKTKACLTKVQFSAYSKESRLYSAQLQLGPDTIVPLSATVNASPEPVLQMQIGGQAVTEANLVVTGKNAIVKLVVIKNIGSIPVTGSFTKDLSSVVVANTSCSNITLKSGQTCIARIVVQGNNQTEEHIGSMSFANLVVPTSVNLTSVVGEENLQVGNDNVNFGTFYQPGQKAIELLVLTNYGNVPATLEVPSLPAGYQVVSNNCFNVTPAGRCFIRLLYSYESPSAFGQQQTAATIGNSNVNLNSGVVSNPSSLNKIDVVVQEHLLKDVCQPMQVSLQTANSEPFISGTDSVINSSGYQVFSDNSCINAISNITIPAYDPSVTVYLKNSQAEAKTLTLQHKTLSLNKTVSTYNVLTTPLAHQNLVINTSVSLIPQGGRSPYTYEILTGTGQVNSAGDFTSTTAGDATIRISDLLGQEILVTTKAVNPLSVNQLAFEKIINQNHMVVASNGLPPYTYSKVSGVGSISSNGEYSSGVVPGGVSIKVSDALNQEVLVSGTIYSLLSVTENSKVIITNNNYSISPSGGKTPYVVEKLSGVGSVNGYIFQSSIDGNAQVKISDAMGQEQIVSIQVVLPLSVNISSFEKVVNQNQTIQGQFGLPPYSYTKISGVGSVNSSGVYSSAVAGVVQLKVTDALNQEVLVSGEVFSVLNISPSTSNITIANNQSFSASGGKTPYTFSKVSGVGTLVGTVFSSNLAGSAQVKVTDSLGQESVSIITVNSNLTLTAGTCTSDTPETVDCQLTSTGGVGVKSYTTNQGTVNSSGVFKGACVSNLGSSIVTVSDEAGNTQNLTLNYPCVYLSCSEVMANSYSTVSGNFWIDPDGKNTGTHTPEKLFCDKTPTGTWTMVTRLNTNDANSRTYLDTTFWEGTGVGSLTDNNDYMAPYFSKLSNFKEIRLQYKYGASSPTTSIESSYSNINNNLTFKQNLALPLTNSNTTWSRVVTGSGESGNFFGSSLIFKTIGNGSQSNISAGGADLSRIWYNLQAVGECNQGGSIGHVGDYAANNWTWEVARGWSGGGTCQHNVYRMGVGSNYDKKSWGGTNISPTDIYSNGFMYIFVKDTYYHHGRSCLDAKQRSLKNQAGTLASGYWTIDPDGYGYGADPFTVYCDMETSSGGWTLVAYNRGVNGSVGANFFVSTVNAGNMSNISASPSAASLNTETMSALLNSTDAMFVSPSYNGGVPIVETGIGQWNYNSTKCGGTLRRTSRTAGCSGQSANDDFSTADRFNIVFSGGHEGVVPGWLAQGQELCYSSKGWCTFFFYVR